METGIEAMQCKEKRDDRGAGCLGLNPDFAVTGHVKLRKTYNFSHFCICKWGLESQPHIIVCVKGLYVKPQHGTCGVVFCWIFCVDPPPLLVRRLGMTIENG